MFISKTNDLKKQTVEMPDVCIREINGQLEITIDKNNRFTYCYPYFKNSVQQEYRSRFQERIKNPGNIKTLKQDIEAFLRECVETSIIVQEKEMDKLYTQNGLTPGDSGYYSNSFVKCH